MSSSTKICFNPDCKDVKSERFRKGWRLRTGDSAELCERCASAYEEGRFCDIFHTDAAGWRSCESCGKRVHCGCIVSVHAFVLLDAGGVDCMGCARKNIMMASNQMWSSSFVLPLPERLKDLSVKNWNSSAGTSAVAGQWHQRHNIWNTTAAQSELHSRIPFEVKSEKLISGEHSSSSSLEKKKLEDPSERVISSSLNLAALDRLGNGNAGIESITAFHTFHREEGYLDGLQGMTFEAHPNSCANVSLQSSTSKDDPCTPHFGLTLPYSPNEANGPNRVSGTQSQRQPLPPPPPMVKQFYANLHNGVESSTETQIRNGRPRGDARARNQLHSRYWPRITDQELQQISGDSNSVITPLFEKMLSASDAGRIGRLVLPKKCAEAYFPTISSPEGLPLRVQDAKGKEWVFQFRFWPNNNSRMYVLEGVTPCIQSMQLQAGDIVTFSRIDPEGKLVMGFRKASSVPPSDQDNQTHKVGNGVSKNAEVNTRKSKPSEVVSTPRPLKGSAESTSFSSINQVNSADPASAWAKVDKSGYIAKEMHGSKSSILPSKRKSSTLGSKSKRLRIENEDLIELKLTWEEAQGLLRPPRNHVPSVVVIEGHEFEEYEEAPILGRPTIFTTNNVGEKIQWAQCEDCSKWRKLPVDALLPPRWTCSDNSWDPKRSSCSSAEELTMEQLEDMLSSSNTDASKKVKATKKDRDSLETSDGLDPLANLANLAILEESETLPPSTQQTTTRHPRHRPGCTCIVCIQPPSGKGPKHKDTCTCNVCLTVRRRFRTLMERREKRQSEKEAETARKKQQQFQEKLENEDDQLLMNSSNTNNSAPNPRMVNESADDDGNGKKMSSSPFKGGIDLNIQPEREDEPSPVSDSGGMTRCMSHGQPQMLASSDGHIELVVNQIEHRGGGAGGENLQNGVSYASGDHLDANMDHHPVTTLLPVSTSATG
ncbi:B3 DNA binding domain [Macleaya cordata]|uniref:B3 DNA binding domain n=1 Tax=Macleaya cordata TaxID=56857 RepID=A0A200QTV0_MACCD|nr:B3 DNA binding domain [Macleaya cordata]